MPPEASSFSGLGAAALIATASRMACSENSSSMAISAPASIACRNSARFSTSTSTGTRAAPRLAGADRARNRARGHDVIFLDEDAVEQSHAVIVAAADPHRILLRGPQAGNGLAGVEQAAGFVPSRSAA